MSKGDIVIAGTNFEPVITNTERQRGVHYIVATYANVKNFPMKPKDFGLLEAGRMCHNFKNRHK